MDYANGKIYMLEPTCEYDEGDVYYGHTTSTLVKRLSEHKSKSNKNSSKYLIEKYGRDNIKIVLMELYPCSCKDELKAVEAKYQRENKCVNKCIAGRTQKEYCQANCEKISEYHKDYYQANHEKLLEQHREYRQANRDKINTSRRILRAEKKKLST
jgi:hypothetical protein